VELTDPHAGTAARCCVNVDTCVSIGGPALEIVVAESEPAQMAE
jgi:hypothetical protein